MNRFSLFRLVISVKHFEEKRASMGALNFLSPIHPKILSVLIVLFRYKFVSFLFVFFRVLQTSSQKYSSNGLPAPVFFDNSFHSARKFSDLKNIFCDEFSQSHLLPAFPKIKVILSSLYLAIKYREISGSNVNALLVSMQITAAITYFYLFKDVQSIISRSTHIIVANDHSPAPLALTAIAKIGNVKTMCLQHAPISSIFPRPIMSYFIVDNYESYALYKKKNPLTKFYIHTLNYSEIRKKHLDVDVVAFALNELIDKKTIEFVTSVLSQQFSLVELKFHPSTSLSECKKLVDILPGNCKVVESTDKLTAKNVLCPLSGVAVELCYMGHLVTLLDIGNGFDMDYYGFLSLNLADSMRIDELDQFRLKDRENLNYSYDKFSPRYELRDIKSIYDLDKA